GRLYLTFTALIVEIWLLPIEAPISLFVFLLLLLLSSSFKFPLPVSSAEPTPAEWPHQFHSVLFMNRSGNLQKVDLWYDWPNGRNLNIIQKQLGKLTYDLEWNNGTSYIYTLYPSNNECRTLHFSVGILRPNWLEGATYLGQQHIDGFLCNVWEKVDFIWYYEDVLTQRPVHWVFHSGFSAHVMTFEVGAVLEDAKWQAPVYCFDDAESEEERRKSPLLISAPDGSSFGRLMTATEVVHVSDAM
ncbi:Transferring glycosyl group transferase, partial [Quillaja saponaria]